MGKYINTRTEEAELTPFKRCCLENFPFIEADFDALTNYELYCKIVEYLNKVIDQTNVNINAINELKTYVDNYFNNLDLQNEVNNKLDQMVADGLFDKYFSEINTKLLNTNKRIDNLIDKKYIFIGDSYGDGYSPDGNVTSWITLLVDKLKLNDNFISKHLGGTGFVNKVQDKNFKSLLEEVPDDSKVTDIVVCGGYNDQFNISAIEAAITDFVTTANIKFPNAKVHIGAIGWSNKGNILYDLARVVQEYNKCAKDNNCHYLHNCEYTLHNYSKLFSSDGIHPNQIGQNLLANNIYEAILYGSCSVVYAYSNIAISYKYPNISRETLSKNLGASLNNNIVEVSTQTDSDIILINPVQYSGRSGSTIELFDIKLDNKNFNNFVIGNKYNYTTGLINCIVATDTNKYYNIVGRLIFNSGKVTLSLPGSTNNEHTNYNSFNIKAIQVLEGFNFTCDSLMC